VREGERGAGQQAVAAADIEEAIDSLVLSSMSVLPSPPLKLTGVGPKSNGRRRPPAAELFSFAISLEQLLPSLCFPRHAHPRAHTQRSINAEAGWVNAGTRER
jgi:hypothetical protein